MQTTQVLQHTLQTDLTHARPPVPNRLLQNMITRPLPQHSSLLLPWTLSKEIHIRILKNPRARLPKLEGKTEEASEHGKREYELSRNID